MLTSDLDLQVQVTPSSAGQGSLLRAAAWTGGLALLAALYVRLFRDGTLQGLFFAEQDRWLLAIAVATLLLLSRIRPDKGRASLPDRVATRVAVGLAGGAGIVAYAGTWLVMERYGLSRDEQLADFAAGYLAQGRLARPIPAALGPYADALMPLWADSRSASGWWVSNYLPVNSAIRALALRAGDAWAAGPVLLMVGIASLWSVARRLWPDRRDAALVAVVAAATSAQLLANAMTPYATTGHFALNALWLACFVRGGRAGHGAAMLVGFAATGLHQSHFFPLFLIGFVAWLCRERRFALAALHAGAAVLSVAAWRYGYWELIAALYGAPAIARATPAGEAAPLLSRLAQFETVTGLARFAAWQNALMLPLAAVGWRAAGRAGAPAILWALRASLGVGLVLVIAQGHGWGYRYLNGLMPCFCLLAAAGWIGLGERAGRPLPLRLLWAGAAASALVAVPVALWSAHRFVHPYAAFHRAARALPARYVLVDVRSSAYLQDAVRLDGPARAPLLMDLSRLDGAALERLCRSGGLALVGRRGAAMLGVPGGRVSAGTERAAGRARRRLAAPDCGGGVRHVG